MFKIITMKNVHISKYTLQFAICTKSMELVKCYSKEKANYFCLIKLLIINVRRLILINVNVSLEANLQDNGKQHCFTIVASILVVEIFLKKRKHQKRMC